MDVRVSILVDASPDELWGHVEQIERHTEWMADADAIRFETDQRRGAGTRFVCETRLGPFRVADRMEVARWEPPHVMAVHHTGIVQGSGQFTLEPISAISTRFTWTEQLAFPWYLGGRLGARLAGATLLKLVWRRNLTRLKRQVEPAR